MKYSSYTNRNSTKETTKHVVNGKPTPTKISQLVSFPEAFKIEKIICGYPLLLYSTSKIERLNTATSIL